MLDKATSASDAKAGLLVLADDYRAAYSSARRGNDAHADQLVAHLLESVEPRLARHHDDSRVVAQIERLRRGQQPLPSADRPPTNRAGTRSR